MLYIDTRDIHELQIPFSGFHYSLHGNHFDFEIEQQVEYFEETTGKEMPDSVQGLFQDLNLSDAFAKYGKEYCENFFDHHDLKGDFSLQTGDNGRIFANVSVGTIFKLFFETDIEIMDNVCKGAFTSYSGFHSHYKNDWREWDDFKSWDYNQFGKLLDAWLYTNHVDDDCLYDMEQEVMESPLCNGFIDECLSDVKGYDKAINISHYLQQRSKRKVKTYGAIHC